jgi:drug/metabolite transporter (DMT)-like permease
VGLAASTLGALAALACALAWTLVTMLTRSLAGELSTFSLNVVRSGLGGAVLLLAAPVVGDLGGLGVLSAGAWVALTVSVVTAVGVGDTAFFESTKDLGLARAMTVSTSYPLMASALAVWLFGERVTPLVAAGSVVTLGGLVLIVSERASPDAPGGGPGAAGRRRGLGLALLAALAWAVSAILIRGPLERIDPLSVQAVRLPLTALLLGLTPWARGTLAGVWRLRATAGWRLAALGLLTAASAASYVVGLKYAGVTLGTVLSSTSPLFALPIGLAVFGEPVTWRAAAGAALAVAGIGLLSL